MAREGTDTADPARPVGALDGVVGRRSVDYLLRNTQQQLVALSGQADLKASMVMTASSLVLSVAGTQWDRESLRPVLYVLAAGLLSAIGAAIAAVVPKFHFRQGSSTDWPAHANPLFFGHFVQVPVEVWVDHMGDVLEEDGRLYRAILVDLHEQGTYLIRGKYRFLRMAYLLLASTFAASALMLAVGNL